MLTEKTSICQDNQKMSSIIETNANELPVLSVVSETLTNFFGSKRGRKFLGSLNSMCFPNSPVLHRVN